MLVLRPATTHDLQALRHFAHTVGPGFTSLPEDDAVLLAKLQASEKAFSAEIDYPQHESYLFALEDRANRQVVGICGIVSATGVGEPFYTYALEEISLNSDQAGVHKSMNVLHLSSLCGGPSEVCTLYLLPEYRHGGAGRLLSLSRFLFMSTFPERFSRIVISELRGVSSESGVSPFWEAVGKHFFQMPFPVADHMVSKGKRFIAELMPKYPIYLDLLPPEAQKVVGIAHPASEAALRLLLSEGFVMDRQVDIFDAGPKVSAQLANLRCVQKSACAKIGGFVEPTGADSAYLLCNHKREQFRSLIADSCLEVRGQLLYICERDAKLLGVEVGDAVSYAPIRQEAKPSRTDLSHESQSLHR